MDRRPLPRRLRAELLGIRDAAAARLIEQLCRQLERGDDRVAVLSRELHELRLSIRRVCAAARLPPTSIDHVEPAPDDGFSRRR